MRTKGAKGKKTSRVPSFSEQADTLIEAVSQIGGAKSITPTIAELQHFGNEDMHTLINKVNEIIKFINK